MKTPNPVARQHRALPAAHRGFTLVEIMIVVAIIGLLATMAIPSFVRCRNKANQTTCVVNLRQIEGAMETWAAETRQGPDAPVQASNILPYLKRGVKCPAGGHNFEDSYQISKVEVPPVCLKVPDGEFVHRLEP